MGDSRGEGAAQRTPGRVVRLVAGVGLSIALVVAAALYGWFQRTARFTGSEFAMDTLITVTVYGPQAEENGRAALAEFQRLDRQLSAYSATSDLGRVNAAAGRQAVRVSRETVDLVALALRYAALSDGRFDPTVGPLVRLWAIGNGRHEPPSPEEVDAARRLVDYRRVMVDVPGRRLYLPERGMALDLGAVAKGYAAGRAADLLRRRGVKSALIDAGGNIVALGARPNGRPWRVGLRHPRKPGAILGILTVVDRAVVTSGDYERYFEFGGRRYHHILDPATGYPAKGAQSATVVASSSTLADILSTTVFILGRTRGEAFARQHGAATIFVDAAGKVSVAPELATAWTPVGTGSAT
ncbi:MAG TPA: FAD:protein FMN transferase [Firmicutes bacterium]|nr:FAD:protein FMN transferase [Bacillota bacterium]